MSAISIVASLNHTKMNFSVAALLRRIFQVPVGLLHHLRHYTPGMSPTLSRPSNAQLVAPEAPLSPMYRTLTQETSYCPSSPQTRTFPVAFALKRSPQVDEMLQIRFNKVLILTVMP